MFLFVLINGSKVPREFSHYKWYKVFPGIFSVKVRTRAEAKEVLKHRLVTEEPSGMFITIIPEKEEQLLLP